MTMPLVGYGDRWSVQPGETIRFMVSSEAPRYAARLVRLIHGDPNPAGPGFKARPVPSALEGEHPGRPQAYRPGSFALVPDADRLEMADGLALTVWLCPTTPGSGPQAVLAKWDAGREVGWALVLDATGAPALRLGDGSGGVAEVSTGVPLRAFAWHRVEASFDPASDVAEVRWTEHDSPLLLDRGASVREAVAVRPATTGAPFTMGAWAAGGAADRPAGGVCLNGKLEAPELRRGGVRVAAWDFSADIGSERVTDRGPFGLHGRTVNAPMRAVTGRAFSGRATTYLLAPEEYGAIFFHDDDLEDAGWEVDFSWQVPDDLASGVYAVHLTAGGPRTTSRSSFDRDGERRPRQLPCCSRPTRTWPTATSRSPGATPIRRWPTTRCSTSRPKTTTSSPTA